MSVDNRTTCTGGVGGTIKPHQPADCELVVREGYISVYRCIVCGSYRERWFAHVDGVRGDGD